MRRRPFLAAWPLALLGSRAEAVAGSIDPASSDSAAPALGVSHRALRFPADRGAHPDTHIEWWYVTGWLSADSGPLSQLAPQFGFQVTFFRNRTGLAETSTSRFAARQLVFAHVALTDLAAGAHGGGLLHDQRAAREGFGLVQTPAATGTQTVQLRDWTLQRSSPSGQSGTLRIAVRSDRFALALDLAATQPLLLQGDAGYSQKGPDPRQASHYYSEPQLAASGRVERAGAPAREVRGRAWLDHEWSNELLPSEAVGWDWVGFNLLDGGALMAFRLRRADGSALWAGGSFRDAAGKLRIFGAGDVRFEPLRRWTSPRTQSGYPVEFALATPAGRWRVVALQDDQELDSRESTGSVYWEGVSALRDEAGAVAGYGYLELTGYAGKLRL
jgi:predicted secreted hydrolase